MRKLTLVKKAAIQLVVLCGLAIAALGFGGNASAQVPSSQPPYNIDLGAVITNTAAVPATINSPQKGNLDKSGVICVLQTSAESGSPTVTFAIQNYDTASADYYTVATSGTIQIGPAESNAGPFVIASGVGIAPANGTYSNPTVFSAVSGIPISRYWRVTETIAGSGTNLTATIGCNQVKG